MPETELIFPPVMWGEPAAGDALGHAVRRATLGCESGLITYVLGPLEIEAALVFAPEVPLQKAMSMLPLCGVGLQNALGALAPPEVAVHLEWDGALRVNGASCGRMRIIASCDDPDATPDWLVVGWSIPLISGAEAPGIQPEQTALYEEGCADITPANLIESWARHTLHWINRWEEDGPQAIHAEWRGLAHGLGEDIHQGGHAGTFLGVDEDFGMLLRSGDKTHLIPLTALLQEELL
jgi:BirA family biotin operon repressor/biotin-[acetyl-CoA-carboxylase] ligase